MHICQEDRPRRKEDYKSFNTLKECFGLGYSFTQHLIGKKCVHSILMTAHALTQLVDLEHPLYVLREGNARSSSLVEEGFRRIFYGPQGSARRASGSGIEKARDPAQTIPERAISSG